MYTITSFLGKGLGIGLLPLLFTSTEHKYIYYSLVPYSGHNRVCTD